MKDSRFSPLSVILNTFFICVIVYFIEYKFLYSKIVLLFGSMIVSTVFTIFAVFFALRVLRVNPFQIGFIKNPAKITVGAIVPTVILGICALITLFAIKHFIYAHGFSLEISFRISTSKLETNTTVISYIISILVAAISAFMLESLLRGLILRVATEHFGFCIANILNVTLTITWHMLIYIFSIIFTNMSTSTFLISILFTCIIYGTSSARKSLYVWATQSIWHCIFDCFISLFVIRNVVLTVNLPIDFIPSNTLEKILVFLTSNSVNSNYLTIAFICAVNILSLIVMIIYYQLLKTRALKKYIKQMKENDL